MDPTEYGQLLRRGWRFVVAAVAVGGLVMWVSTPASPISHVQWQATHVLLREHNAAAPPAALAQLALYVTSGDVPRLVAERLDRPERPAALARAITVEVDEPTGALRVTATGSSAADAAELANAFAEGTLAVFGEDARTERLASISATDAEVARLQIEIDELEGEIAAATARGEATARLETQREARVRQHALAVDQQTELASRPPPSAGYLTLSRASSDVARVVDGGYDVPQSRLGRTVLAMVLGLGIGLVGLAVVHRLDRRIHTADAAAKAFGLPVIAEVPRAKRSARFRRGIALDTRPMSGEAEAYRAARAAVLLGGLASPPAAGAVGDVDEPRAILVTSAAPDEGKTTTVANLAAALAETGRSVLALSCDLRRPTLHDRFGVEQAPGLRAVLGGSVPLRDVVQPTSIHGAYVVPDGGNGLEHLGDLAAQGARVVEEARELADVVILDTAPLLATNDAVDLIRSADAVVVVCRAGRTTVDQAQRVRVLLERLRAPVAGLVVVGAPKGAASYERYYRTTAAPRRLRLLRRGRRTSDLDQRLSPWTTGDHHPPSVEGESA